MKYKQPTYEEYCKASTYAKVRYKFGVYIQGIALLFLIILFLYTLINIEEMKANPAEYAEKKLGVSCNPSLSIQTDYNYNGSYRNIRTVTEGG
jgi:hypothetical protein